MLLEEELKSFLLQKKYNIENGQYWINTLSSNISKIVFIQLNFYVL